MPLARGTATVLNQKMSSRQSAPSSLVSSFWQQAQKGLTIPGQIIERGLLAGSK